MECPFCLDEDRLRGTRRSHITEYINCRWHGPQSPFELQSGPYCDQENKNAIISGRHARSYLPKYSDCLLHGPMSQNPRYL
jgi:hypothetical protein